MHPRNEALIRVISSSFVSITLFFALLVLEYLISLVAESLVRVGSKFYPFGVSSCLNVRRKSVTHSLGVVPRLG